MIKQRFVGFVVLVAIAASVVDFIIAVAIAALFLTAAVRFSWWR